MRTEVRELRSRSSSSSLPGSRPVVGLMSRSGRNNGFDGIRTVSQGLLALVQVTSSGENMSSRRLHGASGLDANAGGAAGDQDLTCQQCLAAELVEKIGVRTHFAG